MPLAVIAGLLIAASPAQALEVRVKDVRTASAAVSAAIELRDVIPDRFKRVLDANGVLHLRIQAELWEVRPVWDRLVYPAIVKVIQMTPSTQPPNPMPMQMELGKSDRISAAGRYYLHVIATVGTVAERDADDVDDAVFGREGDSSLGALGRAVFRTALKISEYMQSVSSEARSRRLNGRDLLRP